MGLLALAHMADRCHMGKRNANELGAVRAPTCCSPGSGFVLEGGSARVEERRLWREGFRSDPLAITLWPAGERSGRESGQ